MLAHPLVFLLLLAAGLAACAYLFLTLERDLRMTATRSAEQIRELAEQIRDLRGERQPAPAAPARLRGQALRRLQKGEPPEKVAAALRLPRDEVNLLLAIDRLTRPS